MKLSNIKTYIQYLPGFIIILYVLVVLFSQL